MPCESPHDFVRIGQGSADLAVCEPSLMQNKVLCPLSTVFVRVQDGQDRQDGTDSHFFDDQLMHDDTTACLAYSWRGCSEHRRRMHSPNSNFLYRSELISLRDSRQGSSGLSSQYPSQGGEQMICSKKKRLGFSGAFECTGREVEIRVFVFCRF